MPRKVRQHVNPFSLRHLDTGVEPLRLPADKRVEVDLGCAAGHYLFRRAEKHPESFLVGIEIREVLVDDINEEARRLGLQNRLQAHYANLLVDFTGLFPPNSVDLITMQFPDPWFKKKRKKRRALTPEMALTLPNILKPGGFLFFQTDIFDVALDALYVLDTELFKKPREEKTLVNVHGPWSFAPQNPLGVPTQRALACKKKGRKVWRLLFRAVQP